MPQGLRQFLRQVRLLGASLRGKAKIPSGTHRSNSDRRQSSEQLAQIQSAALEAAGDAIIFTDCEGTIIWANAAFQRLTGYPREELVGQNPRLLKSGKQPASFYEQMWKTILAGQSWHGELVNRRKDGNLYDEEMTITPVRDKRGEIAHFVAIKRDTSARKAAQQAHAFLASIVESSDDAIIGSTLDGMIATWNRGARALFGYDGAEVIGKPLSLLVPAEGLPDFQAGQKRLKRGENLPRVEALGVRKDGTRFETSVAVSALQNSAGQVAGSAAIIRDISRRKRAEEALRQTEEKYRRIFEDAVVGIFQTTPDGRYLSMNQALARMYGEESAEKRMAEVTDIGRQAYVDPGRWEEFKRLMEEHGEVRNFEFQVLRRDGRKIWFSENARAVREASGKILYYEGTVEDITARKHAEEALRQSEAGFRFLFSNSPLPMWVFSLETLRFLEVNDAAIFLCGYSREEFLRMSILEHLLPEDEAALRKVLTKRHGTFKAAGEWRHRTKNGSVIRVEVFVHSLDWEGQPAEHVVAIDVTERRRAEEALRLSEERSARQAQEATKLTDLVDLLQSCQSVEEAYKVMQSALPTTLACQSGALCVTNSSRNIVEAMAAWGEPLATEKTFRPNDCWALRRSRIHQVEHPESPLRCAHVSGCPARGHLCVPLMAHGETLGVLYLERQPAAQLLATLTSEKDNLSRQAAEVAKRVSLALANLKLREALRAESIRDPLTGLFNRRYMEETLERELSRAARNEQPVSLLMLDLDHFKKFNDTFGHQAGDTLLRALGELLRKRTRGQDIACRYGGEEFALILSGASLDAARQRAELLREDLKQLIVKHAGEVLGNITVSTGISVFPNHGASAEELLRAADAALYRAKAEGRDQVVMA
jgi:diguanylate cyclase (GGDEF)-like protein/PAS domain S-box-containing protein